MEQLDYKKEYKDLYMPKEQPVVIDVPAMNFVAVSGKGNPNNTDGDFQKAIEILYGISYTIKMSKKGQTALDGFFDYVVPPLEGLWQIEGEEVKPDKLNKDKFEFIAMIRLPEFVIKDVFEWAKAEAAKKKKIDTSKAEFLEFTEGLCVQCMHTGPFDNEPATIAKMEEFIIQNGLINDIGETRRHHEIYISDFRKCELSKLKTVLRIPVRKQ